MWRALDLARKGLMHAMPNPMVGAVIVGPDGKIIGEGYHRRCGEAHAEVNAINSVADQSLLEQSTMYVTLEPCSHHGRTGPCAQLIIDKRIPRVVIGSRDPYDKVNGRGIEMLRQAGIEVEEGVLDRENRCLNAVFFTAHTKHRPFIALKWAQTEDGYVDAKRSLCDEPLTISSPLTKALGHRLRGIYDAILVGSGTVLADNPRLDTRLWPGHSPRPIILDRRRRVTHKMRIWDRNPIIVSDSKPLPEILSDLYHQGITSILVEGGTAVLTSFIKEWLWDFIRVETGPIHVGDMGDAKAPVLYGIEPVKFFTFEGQSVKYYVQNPLVDVKNL